MKSVQDRIDELRKAMGAKGISAYIIPGSDPHQGEYVADRWKSREWISGFTGSAGNVVVTMDHAGLWTDSRYFIQGEEELSDSEFELHKSGQGGAEFFPWAMEQLKAGDKLAMDGSLFTAAQIEKYSASCENKGVQLDVNCDLIEEIRTDRKPIPDEPIFLHDEEYAGISRTDKIEKVRAEMKKRGVSAYLVPSLDDIAWLFNIRGRDVEYNPVAIAFAAVEDDKALLFIDPRKVPEAVKKTLVKSDIHLQPYNAFNSYVKSLDKPVYYDPNKTNGSIAAVLPRELKKVTGDSIVMHMKSIKNETEQRWLRKSMIKDGIALTHAYKWLENELATRGVEEVELAEKIAYFRSQQDGYFGESFAAIIGYKGNGAIVHYRPLPGKCKTIERSGMLLTDSGGQYVDGTTDITRTFALGDVTDEQKRDYTLVLKGHIGLATAVFPEGTHGLQLDIKAREHLWKHGLNYGHGTGHGVGFFLNVHEPPQGFVPNLGERGVTVQKSGHFSSNEPGYYVEGSHGIRIENLVVCHEHPDLKGFLQFETMTLYPIDTAPIDKSLMTDEEVKWLNDYHERVYYELAPHLDLDHVEWLKQKCVAI
jgi:Xaa-Pro aminopeptidase